MNQILTFSIFLLILSCKETAEDKKDGNLFVNKNYFSVSEYDRKVDSTRINFVNDSLQILDNIIDTRCAFRNIGKKIVHLIKKSYIYLTTNHLNT